MMLTFNAEALSVEANEQLFKKILEMWKDIPSSIGMYTISFFFGTPEKLFMGKKSVLRKDFLNYYIFLRHIRLIWGSA